MELALFLDDMDKYCGKKVNSYHLRFGDDKSNGLAKAEELLRESEIFADKEFSSLYFGCEFCEYKIPQASQIEDFLKICMTDDLMPVFVTPAVTDYGMERLEKCLAALDGYVGNIGIVVNDYGVLELVYKRDSHFQVIAGRLLDKLSHEYRADVEELNKYYGDKGLRYAASPGILSSRHKLALQRYDIKRYEFDLPLIGWADSNWGAGLSVYWPFHYETTGRVCPFRAMDRKGTEKFLVGEPCSRRCKDLMAEKWKMEGNPEKQYVLFQEGNTVFYVNGLDNMDKIQKVFDRLILQIM